MNIEGKVADAGRYMKGYYNCEEANGKIPYAVLARNSCENVLKYIENKERIQIIRWRSTLLLFFQIFTYHYIE